jgi:hypothetical protein
MVREELIVGPARLSCGEYHAGGGTASAARFQPLKTLSCAAERRNSGLSLAIDQYGPLCDHVYNQTHVKRS